MDPKTPWIDGLIGLWCLYILLPPFVGWLRREIDRLSIPRKGSYWARGKGSKGGGIT
jgi:hypothetical protein